MPLYRATFSDSHLRNDVQCLPDLTNSVLTNPALTNHPGLTNWFLTAKNFLSDGILVLMWILGHDFSGHYNRGYYKRSLLYQLGKLLTCPKVALVSEAFVQGIIGFMP